MVVVGEFDSPAFHKQAEEYATALEGISGQSSMFELNDVKWKTFNSSLIDNGLILQTETTTFA